jgi:hypothetical protein
MTFAMALDVRMRENVSMSHARRSPMLEMRRNRRTVREILAWARSRADLLSSTFADEPGTKDKG